MAHNYSSSLTLSHPPSQANIPASKKWLYGNFLNALKKAVANGDLTKTKGSCKLAANFKKKAAAAAKPKKAPKKKAAAKKKANPEEEEDSTQEQEGFHKEEACHKEGRVEKEADRL